MSLGSAELLVCIRALSDLWRCPTEEHPENMDPKLLELFDEVNVDILDGGELYVICNL